MFMPETDLNVNSGYSWIFLVIFFSPLNTERVEVEIPSTRYLSWLPATVAHKLHSRVTARHGYEGEALAHLPLHPIRLIDEPNISAASLFLLDSYVRALTTSSSAGT